MGATMIVYTSHLDGITPGDLQGFFQGWPNPPSPQTHLALLENSDEIVLAIADNRIVGFITANTDKILTAFIPLLEVLPDYQKEGIGAELVRRMLERLRNFYSIDLLCDPELQSYYEKFGMQRAQGMIIRNYDRQSGHSIQKG